MLSLLAMEEDVSFDESSEVEAPMIDFESLFYLRAAP